MKCIILLLSLSTTFSPSRSRLTPVWVDYLPWNRDMPEDQYKHHISVRLVDKNWKPGIKNMPDLAYSANPNKPVPWYQGSARDAYDAFTHIKDYPSKESPLTSAVDLVNDDGYNRKLESIFLVTTFPGHAKDPMIKNTIIAMAMRGMFVKYNVFVLDLNGLEASMGITTTRESFGFKGNYDGISRALFTFFDSAANEGSLDVEKIHLVGFAYSAVLIGHIARTIRKNRNEKVKSLLALEPHSTGWEIVRKDVFIPTKEDAKIVHTYHTNSIYRGTFRYDATADIVFNNGSFQPGCGVDLKCSNSRSVVMLWFIILYPYKFITRQCTSWLSFVRCRCKWMDTMELTFPPSTQNEGYFYLTTSGVAPFGYEENGAGDHCSK